MIFIGDMHGDIYRMKHIVKEYAGKEKLIFLGDFLDSFRYDVEDQILCVKLAIELVKKGHAEVVMGNHELSYLDPQFNRCSGYNQATAAYIIHLKHEMFKYFKWYLYLKDENILVTHAGLTKYFFDELEMTLETFTDDFDEMIRKGTRTRFYDVGHARGGHNRFGGPMWCDYRIEFKPIDGLKQVFGHTPVKQIDNDIPCHNMAIDCMQYEAEILRFNEDTKVFEIIKIGEVPIIHETTNTKE